MPHARKLPSRTDPAPSSCAWRGSVFHRSVALACIASIVLPPALLSPLSARASSLEPPIIPTVHPTLSPTSAIPSPLRVSGDETLVWRRDLEQRMYVRGNVLVEIGYRRLFAGQAIVWLTPGRESGDRTYDVAIYLTDNVRVVEQNRKGATTNNARELLVTTRITQSALLTGTPRAMGADDSKRFEKGNAAFARGETLRQDLLSKPAPVAHIPNITITDAETALQRGWIARGPGNQLIAGPAETAVAYGASSGTTQRSVTGAGPNATRPAKPRPQVLLVVDRFKTYRLNDKEQVTVAENAFLMRDNFDQRPPLELRAQHAVLFSPADALRGAAATGPATRPAEAPGEFGDVAKVATGVYLEGDVTLMSGAQQIQASRLYYDFTADRAVMLDATLSAIEERRNVPVYMRAAEIRQVSRTDFTARNASFSTSEFHTPHYHIGASNVYLQDVTAKLPSGQDAPGEKTFEFQMKDATINVMGMPVFYWPYLAGDTTRQPIPIRKIRVSNSRSYGPTLQTDWDLLGLMGQTSPKGVRVDLQLDYYGKRGPGAGVDARYEFESTLGLLRSYGLYDTGTDRLGRDPARTDLPLEQEARGRITARHKQALDDNWTLSLEASYITDPNFLENYFTSEYETDKEQETIAYLKRQDETSALTFLGKWSLYDFTANADLADDQYTTEKKPEIKYYRIGDSILDVFTYYSETGVANMQSKPTNYSPSFSGLQNIFAQRYYAAYGPDPSKLSTVTIRDFYRRQLGWNTESILRGDTRHEIHLPLTLGDVKVTPYAMGRFTWWDDAFPTGESGNTTRVYGGGGVRAATQFWKVYEDVDNLFLDIHRLRHIIEPSIDVFAGGADQNRDSLQPFDRDVEGASHASGFNLGLHQRFQTKRGGPGRWRTTDWLVLNINWAYFFDDQDPNGFFNTPALRGYYFPSRPDLSLARNAVNLDGVWRIGERVRLLGEVNINTDEGRVQQAAGGIAVDQAPNLSYFLGTRYVSGLDTYQPFSEGGNFANFTRGASTSNEVTFAIDYQLTRKYHIIFSESYDTSLTNNILTSGTLIRRMPRMNAAVTVTYDANNDDTSFVFTMWPEGFPELGFGNTSLKQSR